MFLPCIFVAILFISATLNFSGSPGGKTGSPGDNTNCTSCHSGNEVITKNNIITTDIPISGYVPGETYTITINANHEGSDRIGFEICAENNSSDKRKSKNPIVSALLYLLAFIR